MEWRLRSPGMQEVLAPLDTGRELFAVPRGVLPTMLEAAHPNGLLAELREPVAPIRLGDTSVM